MRILCAPDSFKGSLTAAEAAAAMARGIRTACPDAEIVPCGVADGGEGTVNALVAATGGQRVEADVSDPLGRTVRAGWGLLGTEPDRAVVEVAAASGLPLLAPEERDPTESSTFGTGQLCAQALDAGASSLVIGLGGSATHDGGCGLAQALGIRFRDATRRVLSVPITGGLLRRIATIDFTHAHPGLRHTPIEVCCDVDNPLTGPQGAAAIYAPQKGATRAQVDELDAGLRHLAAIWQQTRGIDVTRLPGAGAAGGMGGGLVAMLGGRLRPGIEVVLEAMDFASLAAGASLCLTGEGQLDIQTTRGKACAGVTRAAAAHGVPTIGLFGRITTDAPTAKTLGMKACFETGGGLEPDEAMRRAAELLEVATEAALRTHA